MRVLQLEAMTRNLATMTSFRGLTRYEGTATG